MIQRVNRTVMRWVMGIIVAAFLLSSFLMYESGGSRRGRPSSPDGQMQDYVVAEVNGRNLNRSALDQMMMQYLEQLGSREIASTDMPYIYQSALNQYAVELQMEQEVRNSDIKISDAEAEQAMKDYADQAFPTREAFYQYLERSGIKTADYRKSVARQLANEQMLRSVIGDVTLSEDETVQFYDTTKNLFFRQPAGVMVSIADFTSRDAAETVRNLLVSGKTWVEATSDDVTASMDVINITTAPVFISDTAFEGNLAPMKDLVSGEISPVFEVRSDDYAVAVKHEPVEEKITPYDEVSSDIRAMLQQRKEREAVDNFTQRLLSEAKIVIHDETLFPAQTSGVLPVTTETLPVQSADAPDSATSTDAVSADGLAAPQISLDVVVTSGE
ncbi:MAG: SurA N-terminal domain-containing protein [Synergistaceae bacterium]|nr:SurA N-terminal domain-containing protein [Synergistaceae bacterium]